MGTDYTLEKLPDVSGSDLVEVGRYSQGALAEPKSPPQARAQPGSVKMETRSVSRKTRERKEFAPLGPSQ